MMLQSLLAERFKLTLHHTTKDMPMYALVVAKGGSKLKESPEDPPSTDAGGPNVGGPAAGGALQMNPAQSTSIRESLRGYGFCVRRRPLQDGSFVAFATDTQTGKEYKAEAATEQAAWAALAARLGVLLDNGNGKPN